MTDDISLEKDGSVIAHTVVNEDWTFSVYIQSNTTIVLPNDSSGIFSNFTELVKIENFELLDTSNVTNMSSMFMNDSVLQNPDLTSFDTSNVTNMSNMFSGCSKISTLDLSSFNMSNVTNISNMFASMNSLSSGYGRSRSDLAKLNDSSTGKASTFEFTLKS